MFGLLFYIMEESEAQGVGTGMTVLLCIFGVIALIGAAGIFFYDPSWFSRRISIIKALGSRLFVRKVMGDKELQKAVEDSGFIYDWKQDIFYSTMDPWQRRYGYCRLYDEMCPPFGMIVDCEPIYFYYGGINWLIEFWKGQYDMTTGCEVGVYTKEGPCLDNPGAAFYNCAGNSDRLFISYILKKKRETLFTRADKHWWLTGFMLGEFSEPSELAMEIDITFKNRDMCGAFEEGLKKAGYTENEYYINRSTVKILFDKPHTRQPITRTPVTDSITQGKNFILCKNFIDITASETGIGKRIKTAVEKSPELLVHILNIGKTRQLFGEYKGEIIRPDERDRIGRVYQSAKRVSFSDSSKIVIISDCHRGDGGWPDDFSKNDNLYYYALINYYNENYTYIELGDGDELWENRCFSDIKQAHVNVFWLLSRFYHEGRLHLLYGNHDIVKKNKQFVKNNMYEYYDEHKKRSVPLFDDIEIPEGLVLSYAETGDKILLLHGHQGDFLNDTMWRLGRFLVRYLWRPLEMFGITNPTSPAKNYNKKEKVSGRLINWSKQENKMLIAGHTHKPVFPEMGETLYFNSGSCVHPRCITAIEIANGYIMLVKWYLKTRKDATLFVGKEILAGPVMLKKYFGSDNGPCLKNNVFGFSNGFCVGQGKISQT